MFRTDRQTFTSVLGALLLTSTTCARSQDPAFAFSGKTQLAATEAFNFGDAIAADIDADGDLDLVWNAYPPQLDLNDGDANFIRTGSIARSQPLLYEPRVGDFDADGRPDVLCSTSVGLRLYRQGPGLTFTDVSATRLPTVLPATLLHGAIDIGDVDGDGDLDIVVNTNRSDLPWVLQNDGTGTFVVLSSGIGSGPVNLRTPDIDLADLDLDGDLDAVSATRNSSGVAGVFLLVNDGQGGYQVGQQIWTEQRPTCVRDTDDDGFPDVLIAPDPVDVRANIARPVTLLRNLFGVFAISKLGARTYSNPAGPNAVGATLVDTNGDGRLGIAFGAEALILAGVDPLEAMPGNETPDPTPVAADFNGDGAEDLLVGADLLLLSNGAGRYAAASPAPFLSEHGPARAFGDFDDDGRLDVFTDAGVLLNRGDGTFERSRRVAGWNDGLAADFDRDGDPDLFVWNRAQGGTGAGLFVNDGAARFTDATSWSLPAASSASILRAATGDIDGDGDIDLAWIESGPTQGAPAQLVVVFNAGFGTFAAPRAIGVARRTAGLALADFDRNGELDIYLGVGGLWMNRSGVFQEESATRLPAATYDIGFVPVAADFDGDGDADIVLAHLTQNVQFGIGINDGTATFQLLPPPERLTPIQLSAQAIDVDGDGDIDIVAAQPYVSLVLLNDGSGRMTPDARLSPSMVPGGGFPPVSIERDLAADLDDDGDADFVARGRVIENLERQLRAPFVPIRGANYRFEVCSRTPRQLPFGTAVLISFAERRVPLGPLGVFWLEPSLTSVVGSSIAPPTTTRVGFDLTIPLGATTGAPFYAQAVLLEADGSLRLTGVLRERIH